VSDEKKVCRTSSLEEFYDRMGFSLPKQVTVDRDLFEESELKCFEDYFVSLCTDLTIYNQLFGSDDSVAVLNEFNNFIFHRIQLNFIEKICLKIACLMDPAASGRNCSNKNLSLKRFVEIANCPELNKAYEKLYESYEKTGIKTWRNKILAHTDLNTAMGKFTFNLNFEADDLNQIIREIQDIIDLIKDPEVYTDTEVTLPFDSDVNSFIFKLSKLNRATDA
jgi:hypothetical protein